MRQIFGDIGWEKKILAFFGAVGILILLGPFGTYEDLGFWERSVFWVIIVGGVGFFMHITMTVALATQVLERAPQVLRLFVGAIIGGFPGAAVVFFVNAVLRPPLMEADAMPTIWLQVSIIGFVIGVLEYIDWRAPNAAQAQPPDVRTALHSRLKAADQAELISMSMHDHYVEVTTSAGKEFVLMRFSDAIAEASPVPGTRIHRSHWVANKHIAKLEREGHRMIMTVSDNRKLAVSKSYIEAAKEAFSNAQ
ncbi:MAG: LytTR family DNA-binding domain-containing protein [Pseudomonadota bacterium]